MSDTLGAIVWFSVAGAIHIVDHRRIVEPVLVSSDSLAHWFTQLKLDRAFLPPPARSIDAFKKASSQTTRQYGRGDGVRVTLALREVSSDDELLIRHVVAEETFPRKREIRTTKVGEVKYFRERRLHRGTARDSYRIKHRMMDLQAPDDAEVRRLLDDFYDKFNEHCRFLTAPSLRAAVRSYLNSLDAILVRPQGGIYFCQNEALPTVQRLAELLQRMGPGCRLHTIPLPDTAEQRSMLVTAYESDVEDSVRVLLLDITAYATDEAKPISQSRYQVFATRVQSLLSRVERHTAMLGLPSERSGLAVEQAMIALDELKARVRTR